MANIPKEPLSNIELVEACLISQPDLDFRSVCSCKECNPKIELLKGFEKEIKSKNMLNKSHFEKVQEIKRMCSINILSAAEQPKWMLYVLHRKLDELTEEFGQPMTPEESHSTINACDQIFKSLEENDFCPKSDENYPFQKLRDEIEKCDFLKEIDTAKLYFGRTGLKDLANPILDDMEKNEKEQKDNSELSDHLRKQIELVKGLPVRELQEKVDDAIVKFCPLDAHVQNFSGARQHINSTLKTMIRICTAFWKNYKECPSQDHTSSGLDQTLDKLVTKVGLFNAEWKSKYEPFLENPYNRSNLKKQRIDEPIGV